MSNSNVVAIRFLTEGLANCETGNELLTLIDAYLASQ